MGFLKDYGAIKKETRKLKDNSPGTGARMAEMNQKMADLNASMSQSAALQTPASDSVPGRIQVVSVAPTTASVNGQPFVDVVVTVLAAGRPPVPAQARVLVPPTSLHRLQPGVTLPVHVDPTDLTAFAIDWTAPG